jgi:hypothetical protein
MTHYHDRPDRFSATLAFRRGITLLFLAVSLPIISLAQTTNESTLPPKAQAAVKKGLGAAKQAEWTVAIRYFNEARQAAPDSPVPLVNLGLAESQLPGHELRAVCWFEAYLILVPTAVNAPAVRQQISDLETRAEGNADKIIDMLKVLAGEGPSSDYWTAYADIAGLLAASDDLDAAEQIVASQSDKNIQSMVREKIVEALVNFKRIPDAIKEADQIPDYKGLAYGIITSAQVAAGSFSDAKKSMLNLSVADQWTKGYELAEAEYRTGQKEDAATILNNIKSAFTTDYNRPSSGDNEINKYLYEARLAPFAVAEYKMGMQEDADTIFKQIKDYAYNTIGTTPFGHTDRTPLYDRTALLQILAGSEEQTGRHSIALQLVNDAESACREAVSAHEKFGGIESPVDDVLGRYEEIKEWDGARSWLNQNRGNVDINYKADSDWLAKLEADDLHASTKAASIKILSDATASSTQRAQAWSDYIKGCLSAPLFTSDFKVTMAGLVSFTPSADDQTKSQTVFDHVKQPAADLIDRLNDIHELEGSEIRITALGDTTHISPPPLPQ